MQIDRGDIQLNAHWFTTRDYEPPSYQRSLSYEDTFDIVDDVQVPLRTVTDMGPLLGIWKPFTVLCYNADNYQAGTGGVPIKGRGQYLYDTLLQLFRGFIATPLTLYDGWTKQRHQVLFGPEGLDVRLAPPRVIELDEYGQELGAEYEVTLSLIEVS